MIAVGVVVNYTALGIVDEEGDDHVLILLPKYLTG